MVVNGNYYRRKEDGATVKVLYCEVYPYGLRLALPQMIFRYDEDEYPHRREFITVERFLKEFEEK